MRDPLRHRSPELVRAILDAIYADDHENPVPWTEAVDAFTSDAHNWRTVENTLYDLVQVGALHRVGHPASRTARDTRALHPTLLGHHWRDQTLHPLPERSTP